VVDVTGEKSVLGTEAVLLADDEDLVRELGQRILQKNGYVVLTATNGVEALDVFSREKERIALVILDLIMPSLGGKDCLRELLKIDPSVRVLISSGLTGDASSKECMEIGAKGFVPKPFRSQELLKAVRKVLDET
jgi:DNA-binding response OmpR family regulator